MKKKEINRCPGCSHHCPMDNLRCKRGRAYFAKINPVGDEPPRPKHKWEKYVTRSELAWKLLHVSRRAKKALCRREIDQQRLISCLSEGEKNALADILNKLDAQLG